MNTAASKRLLDLKADVDLKSIGKVYNETQNCYYTWPYPHPGESGGNMGGGMVDPELAERAGLEQEGIAQYGPSQALMPYRAVNSDRPSFAWPTPSPAQAQTYVDVQEDVEMRDRSPPRADTSTGYELEPARLQRLLSSNTPGKLRHNRKRRVNRRERKAAERAARKHQLRQQQQHQYQPQHLQHPHLYQPQTPHFSKPTNPKPNPFRQSSAPPPQNASGPVQAFRSTSAASASTTTQATGTTSTVSTAPPLYNGIPSDALDPDYGERGEGWRTPMSLKTYTPRRKHRGM